MGSFNKSQFHRSIPYLALPYKTYITPETTQSAYVTGSADLLTSAKGYAERRPGFSDTLEVSPTTFNNLQRVFAWNRYDGTFIEMACDINASNQAVAYKRVVGTDNSFLSIFTDTGSNTPFDFIVSNNAVYFSNGNTAKKYDAINGATNWGIAIGSVNNATGPNIVGAGADTVSGVGTATWTSPGNITANDGNRATVTLSAFSNSHYLQGTNLGFAISSTSSITGIKVELKNCTSDRADAVLQNFDYKVNLLQNGNVVGTSKFVVFTNTGSGQDFTLGSTSDLWGTTWSPNDINQSTFGVNILAENGSSSGTWTSGIDYVRVTVYSLGGPTISVSGSAGAFSATTGYQYVFCYGNSNTGHINSPTPPSLSSGSFTSKLNVQVSLTASTDSQVNQIHVYRSTDSVASGSTAGVYFELPTSPYANTTQNITDNAADSALNINSIAPTPGFNDPPTPGFAPVYFSGRVWMFKNNQVFYSALEECIAGVPEESFPSGIAGNFWNFDQTVTGLAVSGSGPNQTLLIFTSGRVYGITGTTQDTFRRFLISDRRGCTSRTNIASLGGMVAWVDTSTQIWSTDGNSAQELSLDIRPDLKTINQQTSSLTFHASGEAHWLCLSTGTKLYVADLDTQMWMPPWSFSANYIRSIEATSGTYLLVAAAATQALTLNQSGTAGKYNDGGATYQPIGRMTLKPLVPDFSNYSAVYAEIASQPTRTGYVTGVQINTNGNTLGDVSLCVDDDPTNSTTGYISITRNIKSPEVAFNRRQGVNLVQNIYPTNKEAEGRWVGVQFKAQNADDNFRAYSMLIGINELGR